MQVAQKHALRCVAKIRLAATPVLPCHLPTAAPDSDHTTKLSGSRTADGAYRAPHLVVVCVVINGDDDRLGICFHLHYMCTHETSVTDARCCHLLLCEDCFDANLLLLSSVQLALQSCT
jgi:hypothetical protein